MGDFNEVPDVDLETALGIKGNSNQAGSLTYVAPRNIDTRSGNLIVRDATNPRIFLGYQNVNGTDFYGMKVSKTGYDVTTEVNSNLVFNSSQNVFKIVASGTINTTSLNATSAANSYANNSVIITQTHGLGYNPAFVAFMLYGANYIGMPWTVYGNAGATTASWATYSVLVDSLNVYIQVQLLIYNGSVTASAVPIKYYLLQETSS